MKRLSIALLLAATAALAGCKKKSSERDHETPVADAGKGADGGAAPDGGGAAASRPVLSSAQIEEAMTRMVALTTALGDVVDANKDNCASMAAAVERVMADNKAFVDQLRKYKGDPAAQKMIEDWMKRNGKQMMAAATKMAAGQRRCGSDPAVRRAFRALDM